MSGVYIGVDGKARKVKGAYIGIDGKARKIKKGYIGDENGVARLCWSAGKTASDYDVGDAVYLNENGTPVEYLVVHQGRPSDMYDESCNGTWLLRKDLYANEPLAKISDNDYKKSIVNEKLNSDFFNLFDTDTKNAIKTAKIPYVDGVGESGSVVSGLDGLATRVFLLSGYEVGFTTTTNSNIPVDGVCLDYFSGMVDKDSRRIGRYNGNIKQWALRSPSMSNVKSTWVVYIDGSANTSSVYLDCGVRPAVIVKSGACFDPTTNILIG